jgi:hypothetical protein
VLEIFLLETETPRVAGKNFPTKNITNSPSQEGVGNFLLETETPRVAGKNFPTKNSSSFDESQCSATDLLSSSIPLTNTPHEVVSTLINYNTRNSGSLSSRAITGPTGGMHNAPTKNGHYECKGLNTDEVIVTSSPYNDATRPYRVVVIEGKRYLIPTHVSDLCLTRLLSFPTDVSEGSSVLSETEVVHQLTCPLELHPTK